jgi:hypothetical protein
MALSKKLEAEIKANLKKHAIPPDVPVMLVEFDGTTSQYGYQPKVQAYITKASGTIATAIWPTDVHDDGKAVASYIGMKTNDRDTSKGKWYWTTSGCGFDKMHDIAMRVHKALGRDGMEATYQTVCAGYQSGQITIRAGGH